MQNIDPTRPDPSRLNDAPLRQQEIEQEVRNERIARATNDSSWLAPLLGLLALVVVVVAGASYMMSDSQPTNTPRSSAPIPGSKAPSVTPAPTAPPPQ